MDSMTKKKAIIISKFQGKIEWDKVKNDNVDMAFSRLGEGKTFIDHTFIDNFKHSKKAGILSGGWHIFRAKSSKPEGQAKTIIKVLKEAGFSSNDYFAFEVYNQRGDNRTATKEEMSNNLAKLIELILESDLPISENSLYIKTNIDTWKNSVAWELHADFFRKVRLWIEQWHSKHEFPDSLEPWGDRGWSLWEYSSKGVVKGITGDVLISHINLGL